MVELVQKRERIMGKYETLKIILKNVKHPVLLIFLLFLFASAQPLFAYGTSMCIDNLNSKFMPFLLGTICIAVIGLVAETLSGKLLIDEARNIELFMQQNLIDNFCRMQPGKLENEIRSGYFMKFYRDCTVISSAFKVLLPFFVVAITNLLVIFVLVISKNSILLLCLMVLPFIICGFFLFPYRKNISEANCSMIKAQDKCADNLLCFFSAFANMKVNAVEKNFSKRTKNFFNDQNETIRKVETLDLGFELKLKTISTIFKCILLACTGAMAANGMISLGDVVLYQLLLSHIADAFGRSMSLVQFIGTYGEAFNSFSSGLSNFYLEDENTNAKKIKLTGNLSLKNASMSYAEKNIFKNLSVDIEAGHLVVISGDNGTGKSTLLKMLATFHKPERGCLFFDGVNSEEIDLFDLRRQIFYLSQNQQLLDVSFLDNVTLGENKYTDKQIDDAMANAGLSDLYAQIKTQTVDQTQYSGGELQRIAIAQAILRSPQILFIDELENHLDRIGYNIYVNWLKKMKGTITIVAISHKTEIIGMADQILDLNTGSFAKNDSAKEGIYQCQTAVGNGGLL